MRCVVGIGMDEYRERIAMSRSSSAQCSRSQARTEGGSEAGKEDVFLMEGERERERSG